MTRRSRRSGFTLVEVLIASTVSTVIFLAIASTLTACFQLHEAMMADTELSLRTRELRDKLLFHEAAPHGNVYHAGLLSGLDASVDSASIGMTVETIPLDGVERGTRTLRLRVEGGKDARRFRDDAADDDPTWLFPGRRFAIAEDWREIVDTRDLAEKSRIYIDLPLSATIRTPFGRPRQLTRRERLTVPLFGAVQPTDVTED